MTTNITPSTTSTAIDTTRILDGVMDRAITVAKVNYDVVLDMDQQTELYNFLCTRVTCRTRVCFTKKLPEECDDYDFATFEVNESQILNVAYGKNMNKDDSFPYILFLSVNRKERSKDEKFEEFWKFRRLPLFEEALKWLNLSQPVEIEVFERAYAWNARRKAETGQVNFIGQEPHAENGSFIPNKPIGYVVGNKVVLTNPNEKLEGGRAYYTFK